MIILLLWVNGNSLRAKSMGKIFVWGLARFMEANCKYSRVVLVKLIVNIEPKLYFL